MPPFARVRSFCTNYGFDSNGVSSRRSAEDKSLIFGEMFIDDIVPNYVFCPYSTQECDDDDEAVRKEQVLDFT